MPIANIDGQLRLQTNEDGPMPMKALTEAFQKLKYNEKLNDRNIRSLIGFIDSFITVSTHANTVGKDVARIAKEVNEHHHTKTCAKSGDRCLFHYPKPPAPYTIIVQPNKESSIDWEQSRVIIDKVMDVLSDDKIIEKIMEKYDKDNEDQKSYCENRVKRIKDVCKMGNVEALGMSKTVYSVVKARDIDELCINPYNEEWLRPWNRNMDIQPVLDFFAVITYLTDYYSKDDTALW